ncbi:MAG: hypothetical protein O3A10_05030 [Chloroflexi bacterium]|nr:hypothetical protein [Chloroflexota bacterium]MDA1145496.1 hypothetical protein [Chloroflexota bacterium]
MRLRWLSILVVVPVLLALACGGSDATPDGTAGSSVGDRYLRLFEVRDFGSSLFVYDAALPPDLAELLNPGMTEDTPDADIIAVPVPADGVLIGSYHVRRRDGTNEIWLSYDVPFVDTAIEETLRQLLDETPWQVTGGQSNELFAAISFQSTRSGDIEGFATVQSLPATPTFSVTVRRGDQTLELELPRGAFIPEIDARFRELSDGLEVTQVLSDRQLQEGDVITAVGEMPVVSALDLFTGYRALGRGDEPRSAVLYRLTIQSPAVVEDPVFAIPAARPLPEGFPADFLVIDDLTVVEVTWNNQPTGDIYQVTMVTPRSGTEVAQQYRDALASAGWELTGDEAQGFGTLLNFEHIPNNMVGVANIDQFESDQDLNSVIVQIQVGRGTN